jgi:hypothetical protein
VLQAADLGLCDAFTRNAANWAPIPMTSNPRKFTKK